MRSGDTAVNVLKPVTNQWNYSAGTIVYQEGRCNQDQHLRSFLSGPGIIRELFRLKKPMTMEVFLGLPVEPAD